MMMMMMMMMMMTMIMMMMMMMTMMSAAGVTAGAAATETGTAGAASEAGTAGAAIETGTAGAASETGTAGAAIEAGTAGAAIETGTAGVAIESAPVVGDRGAAATAVAGAAGHPDNRVAEIAKRLPLETHHSHHSCMVVEIPPCFGAAKYQPTTTGSTIIKISRTTLHRQHRHRSQKRLIFGRGTWDKQIICIK